MSGGAVRAFAMLVAVSLAGAALAAFVVVLLPAGAFSAEAGDVLVERHALQVTLPDGSPLPPPRQG